LAVRKTILLLSLFVTVLVTVPAASEKVKPPTPEEMRVTIKNLEDVVEEQQERLRIHKLEIEALRKTVRALENRLESLEQSASQRQAVSAETAQR
jgi:hypothetical protein